MNYDAKCINDATSMKVAGVLNTFSELIMAVLPFAATFYLKVDRRQRWGVIGLLSLGILVAFCGIFRTFFIWKLFMTYDLSWWSIPQWISSEVENYMALVSLLQLQLLI
jgi:hypothetical protein